MKRTMRALVLLTATGGFWLTALVGCQTNGAGTAVGTDQLGRSAPAAPVFTGSKASALPSPATVAWDRSPAAASSTWKSVTAAKPDTASGQLAGDFPSWPAAAGAAPSANKTNYLPAQSGYGRYVDSSEPPTAQESPAPFRTARSSMNQASPAADNDPSASSGQTLDERSPGSARVQANSAVAQPFGRQSGETAPARLADSDAGFASKYATSFPANAPGRRNGNTATSSPAEPTDESKQPSLRIVNTKRIKLHFEVKDAGPSGISGVELWYTRNHRDWKRPDILPQRQGPYVVEVEDEGLYGFTLVARNNLGHGEPAPKPGDLPQVWVLVDLTAPVVKILSATVATESDGPKLAVAWTATDKYMGRRPVTLLYAEQPEGPWVPLAANLESVGSCQIKVPSCMPRRFLLRMEATDLAGNIGTDQIHNVVEIDQSQPRVSISKID
ncbi:MAG TPA: hypothetical protein VKI17_00690 [Gemmataceae bacterium]|nr:hypothetical protein [Gemmataceae bacterium]